MVYIKYSSSTRRVEEKLRRSSLSGIITRGSERIIMVMVSLANHGRLISNVESVSMLICHENCSVVREDRR